MFSRLEEEQHRTLSLRRSIDKYRQADALQVREVFQKISSKGYTAQQQKINSFHEQCLDHLLNDAHQWRKCIKKSRCIRIKQFEDTILSDKIRHIRNLKEHWEQNKRFFSDLTIPIPDSNKFESARWYHNNYPDKMPWSSGWSNINGSTIAGILNLEELEESLNKFDQLLENLKTAPQS
jgi:hypothetical protein